MTVLSLCWSFALSSSLHAQDPAQIAQESVPPAAEAAPELAPPLDAPTTSPGNVSLDFKDADINNVLRILSLKSRVNIVAGPEVQGTVTIRLEDVPWEKALDIVLRTYGYVYERQENVIRVTTKDNLASEELVTETYVLNYTTAKEAEDSIKDLLSERGRVKSVARTNMIVVTDIPTNLYKIREVVQKLDKSTPQAHVDAKIVKTQLQEGENLGIQWSPAATLSGAQKPVTFPFSAFNKTSEGDPISRFFGDYFPGLTGTGTAAGVAAAGTAAAASAAAPNPFNIRSFPLQTPATVGSNTYTFGTLNFSSFSAVLNFLRERDNTKIVSNPRITVLNNQKARIKVGTDVALPTFERNEQTGSFEISGYTFRETGVTMDVTPHINDANEIMVDLKPEVSSQSGATTFSSSTTASFTSIPNFAVENAETQVLIKSGETIAIGGLMTDKTAIFEDKVPVLGDIPLIGKLFRSKRQASGANNEKVETLFFVTVTIVDNEGQPSLVTMPQAPNVPIGQTANVGRPQVTAPVRNVERVG